eukprot:1175944-Prorocentrum_minimum.AAC.1
MTAIIQIQLLQFGFTGHPAPTSARAHVTASGGRPAATIALSHPIGGEVTDWGGKVTGWGSEVTGWGGEVTGWGSEVTGWGGKVTGWGGEVTGWGSEVTGWG